MASIQLEHVSKAYGKLAPVVRDVNLRIGDNEFCVFVGPSGCGKSTLLRMVAGLESITSGELRIGDTVMNDVPPARRGVAMVFQSYALFPHMSVFENMAFGLRLARCAPADIDRRVRSAAQILQLEALLDRMPKALSGGQRQRVAIGRAIVREPDVFLFDEPLSNLDAALRVQTRFEIARLHRDFGRASAIYVTHDQVEAMTLADRIVLLNTGAAVTRDGSVAQCGTPLELYHQPRNRFVAAFIGSPRMNFAPARLLQCDGELATLQLRSGETVQARVDARGQTAGAELSIGIRPEDIEVGAPGPALARDVLWQERLGEATYLYLDAAGSGDAWVAKAPGNFSAAPGHRVALRLPPERVHVFDAADVALPRTVQPEGLPAMAVAA